MKTPKPKAIDATPYIHIAPVPDTIAANGRLWMAGCLVTRVTDGLCNEWMARTGLSRGELLDQVFAFAELRGWMRPVKSDSKKGGVGFHSNRRPQTKRPHRKGASGSVKL